MCLRMAPPRAQTLCLIGYLRCQPAVQEGRGDLIGPFPQPSLTCPPSLQLKEHPEKGVHVKGLSMHTVHSVAQCERIMETGWKNRSVGYTLMNKDSSRSHSIFTISIEIYAVGMWSQAGWRGAGRPEPVSALSSQDTSPLGASRAPSETGKDAQRARRQHEGTLPALGPMFLG